MKVSDLMRSNPTKDRSYLVEYVIVINQATYNAVANTAGNKLKLMPIEVASGVYMLMADIILESNGAYRNVLSKKGLSDCEVVKLADWQPYKDMIQQRQSGDIA